MLAAVVGLAANDALWQTEWITITPHGRCRQLTNFGPTRRHLTRVDDHQREAASHSVHRASSIFPSANVGRHLQRHVSMSPIGFGHSKESPPTGHRVKGQDAQLSHASRAWTVDTRSEDASTFGRSWS
jgi:hypothetical protein